MAYFKHWQYRNIRGPESLLQDITVRTELQHYESLHVLNWNKNQTISQFVELRKNAQAQ